MTVPRSIGNPSSSVRLFIETPRGSRVGAVIEGCVLRRSGRGLWTRPGEPEGWAFRQDLLDRAAELGVEQVEVMDRERRRCYRTSLAAVRSAPAVVVPGWGLQRILSLDAWEVIEIGGPTQVALFPAEAPA